MNRDDIKTLMLRSGFTYEKTVASYPSIRGDEDVYTRYPEYPHTFRISRVDKTSDTYGLYAGIGKQFQAVDAIVTHNTEVAHIWNSEKPLPMWTGETLKKLLIVFEKDLDSDTHRNENEDELLITTILPIVNQ